MTNHGLVDHTDPRLQIAPSHVRGTDPMTRAALRLVADALGASGDAAIAAPALGLPVRVMGLRIGDLVHSVTNPVLTTAQGLHLSRGEMTRHTGPLCRDVMRARNVTIEATNLAGRRVNFELTGRMALDAQQAFDLLDAPDPFGWMTPSHRIWSRSRGTPLAARFEAVNRGLHAVPDAEGLAFTIRGRRAVTLDGTVVAQIDADDPILPVAPRDRLLLALALQFTSLKTAFFSHPSQFGLALSALLFVPDLSAHAGGCPWPAAAERSLGLGGAVRQHPAPLWALPEGNSAPPPMDFALLDLTLPGPAPDLSGNALTRVARALAGSTGALAIVSPAADPAVEQALQRHFAAVYVFADGDAAVYLARKSPMPIAAANARLIGAATRTGLPGLPDVFQPGTGHHLCKDGRREPLA